MIRVNKISSQLKEGGIIARNLKAELARELVSLCYDKDKALAAEKEFNEVFRDDGIPSQVPEFEINQNEVVFLDLVMTLNLFSSKSEAKRMIIQGGVRIDGNIENDWKKIIQIKKNQIIQVGKRKFAKIK
jgi:tyrosyl-tRNA synthetase